MENQFGSRGVACLDAGQAVSKLTFIKTDSL